VTSKKKSTERVELNKGRSHLLWGGTKREETVLIEGKHVGLVGGSGVQ